MQKYSCPSCGAPIEIKNRFSKVVVCNYCDTHSTISDSDLTPKGKFAKIAQFPSVFNVGSTGTLLGKSFRAMGRIRYDYGDGHYDEWFLDYDGEKAWFTEDEGTFCLFTDLYEAAEIDDINNIRAGQNIQMGDMRVMVKEKGEAKVASCEGELYFYTEPGTEVIYIDGIADGKKVSIEYSEDEVEMFIGRPVLRRDIEVEG